ncbi:hypothetical protein ACFP9V_22785 [Deinococcus radiopugnans]|uniref:Stage III sporulation protein SpoIIIAA n=1 Tax=Deinococcus radiopugnans ATCC 19172 TaxID=585398 RepID=A0A5C4Y6K5_9DEIO|nr:hypothetical protein [Deinococcus radiopugnans]MBB6017086.1 stage III sporulation protein SpoIIIAA [Deinococcus radiopugnans ATCC 19172]TNM70680.1 hypothetical protein FHR04_12330 [Deinococcus radiopugnans ATCC 19172]
MSVPGDQVLERVQADYDRLLNILPTDIGAKLRPVIHEAEEAKLRFGRPLKIKHHGQWQRYDDLVVTQLHLTEFRSNFDGIRDDNRAGIDGTGHRISRIPSADGQGTDGFNLRIARFYGGVADVLRPYLHASPSMLICGLAGKGKSTVLRDVARIIAEKYDANVTIVDTSNEVAGDGRVPHPGIGEADRYFVPVKAQQHEVMLEVIANNSAHIVVIDEVQTEVEAEAIRSLSVKAVFTATTHGSDLVKIIQNGPLQALFHPEPVFRWALMIPELGHYHLYDLAQAVRAVNAGCPLEALARFYAKVEGGATPSGAAQTVSEAV